MKKDRIFPNWEQIHAFKTSLTDGEMTLTKFLDDNLPLSWEIYVQPYFNGDRPDLVILNPSIGIMIYEIKDWFLRAYHFQEKWYFDEKTNKNIKGYQYFVTNAQGTSEIEPPISQADRYRTNLINFYIPQIGEAIDQNSKNFSAFKIGLYFHNATTEDAQQFIPNHKRKCSVIGKDAIEKGLLDIIVPDANREKSFSMKEGWANEVRFWLKPPFHSIEQGIKIKLTSEQKEIAKPAHRKHQRLRGVAGSGKTLVLAQRAANLASQNKKVLIVTFNITLWHYIRDHVSRARYGFEWELIEFKHFHGFCFNFLRENDVFLRQNNTDEDEFFDKIVPEKVLDVIKLGENCKKRNYDAILIDEGQDFHLSYYKALCEFLTKDDELLLVVDERQNLYKRKLNWLDSSHTTKFKDDWVELKESYRIPKPILEQANRFATLFLPDIGLIPIPAQGELFPPHLIWRNIQSFSEAVNKIWAAIEWLTKTHKIHPQDIIILIPTHAEGWRLVKYFEQRNIKINHVFEDMNKSHHHKQSFWMGDSRLKMSTIHSFKGWELRNIILLTPIAGYKMEEVLDFLLYIAITRTRQTLIVFNRHSKYIEYGKNWPEVWNL